MSAMVAEVKEGVEGMKGKGESSVTELRKDVK
jgi:hypothetical protein